MAINRVGAETRGMRPLFRRTREVIDALPKNDAGAAVKAVFGALEDVIAAESLTIDERFTQIEQLDMAAQPHARVLMREYLNTPRQIKLRESLLWNCAYDYWSEIITGYVRCVQRYEADVDNATAFRPRVPVALARAFRAMRHQVQWTRVRYRAVSGALWARLADLYAFIESANADAQTAIYGTEMTTVRREFVAALMQASLSCENLPPAGQGIAASMISRYAPMFVLSKTPDSGCTHWFAMGQAQAPARINRAQPPEADVRYFGAGPAVAALGADIKHLEDRRELPAGMVLDDAVEPVFVRAVLLQLRRDWSGKVPSRQHERQKASSRLTVVPGFRDALRTIEFAGNNSLDFTDQPTAESWLVEDISDGGYGAVLPALAGDWVEVGSLLGVEGDVPNDWRIGVVRRVQRLEGNRQRVGVQLLSRHVLLVRLQRMQKPGTRMGASQRIPLDQAILLTDDPSDQKEVEILVRGGSITNMEPLHMLARGQQYLLRPKAVVERSSACERVVFAVVKVDA